jgi:YD repeat-containing protein
LAVVREVKGRVASLQWAFAPPQSDTPQARARPWRGYTYDARARLETSYEDFGVGAFVDTSSLVQGEVTRGQVQGLGAGKDEWAYGRELSGSTLSISNQRTGDSRFALRRDRDFGYQHRGVEVDGASFAVTHDTDGRMKTFGGRTLHHDVRGRLVQVDEGGAPLEAYAYDGLGRLVATFDGA